MDHHHKDEEFWDLRKTRNLYISLIIISMVTGLMIYEIINREHWSLKVSGIFVAAYGLAAMVNLIKILLDEKKKERS